MATVTEPTLRTFENLEHMEHPLTINVHRMYSGTIGGKTFGVSKNIRLVAVKVLSDSGLVLYSEKFVGSCSNVHSSGYSSDVYVHGCCQY